MPDNFTIFYADDDADDLEFFRDVTDTFGDRIHLYTHSHGDQLLTAVRNPPPVPQLIFLDINMPGKSGFEVLQELKKSEKYKNIPVVMFSTSNSPENVSKSMQLGANFYVTKPDSIAKLKQSIEYTLNINWKVFKPTLDEFVYKAIA